MGLDMFLYAERYLSEYTEDEEEKSLLEEVENVIQYKMPGKIRYVTSEAMYWRKANAIHHWFVKHVQDGVDDCKKYYVSTKKLIELRDTLSEILANKDKVEELLPHMQGFFFGSYDYDEYYFNEIERTEKELTDIINDWKDDFSISFYYQASW